MNGYNHSAPPMQMLTGRCGDIAPQLFEEIGRYRHKVFVEMLKWELLVDEPGIERDQFDREDTLYVVARDEAGAVIGTARLLPTTRPYLLGEVFPELLAGAEPPKDERVWELSRFAAVDFGKPVGNAMGQFSAYVAASLLAASLEAARAQGAERVITVSPLGIERLLRRGGYRSHRAGPPQLMGGHPIFACWIDTTDPACLAQLERDRVGLAH